MKMRMRMMKMRMMKMRNIKAPKGTSFGGCRGKGVFNI